MEEKSSNWHQFIRFATVQKSIKSQGVAILSNGRKIIKFASVH
jgi:hypothetical protein